MDIDYFDFLKSCFDEWNIKNPEKNTIRGLARLTGIGKNVVYNMANGIPRQSKYGYRDVNQYLKRTQVEKSLYLGFIKTHYQDFIAFAEQYIFDRESDKKNNDEKLIEILRRPIGCEIFQACVTKRGMSRSEIKERFGLEGLTVLNQFIRNEILAERNGRIKHSQLDDVVFDNSLSNRLIRHNVEDLDLKKLDDCVGKQWILVRSVSKEAFEEIKNVGHEAFEKLHRLTSAESGEEDAVIVKINYVMDSFNHTKQKI